jgi:hypothetical protein
VLVLGGNRSKENGFGVIGVIELDIFKKAETKSHRKCEGRRGSTTNIRIFTSGRTPTCDPQLGMVLTGLVPIQQDSPKLIYFLAILQVK